MRPALLLLLPLVVACGGGPTDRVATAEPGTDLVVEVAQTADGPVERWRLTCDPVGGDHPAAEQACRDLEAAEEPFAPPPDDQVCTEIYGGPQTARVTGTVDGEPVERELSRINGCRIAEWDRLGAVLPAPEGPALAPETPQ